MRYFKGCFNKKVNCIFSPQALQNNFFDFDTFDVEEYENYEVGDIVKCHFQFILFGYEWDT